MTAISTFERCVECGGNIQKSRYFTAHIQTSSDEHEELIRFCCIGCLTDWAAEYGYRDDDDGWWQP